MKPDGIVNPMKNTFLINRNILYIQIIQYHFSSLNTDQSFEIFPKHNGVATILESFALNL